MAKRAESSEKEKRRKERRINDYECVLAEIEHRRDEYYDGLSDAHRYIERRGYGEQDYW